MLSFLHFPKKREHYIHYFLLLVVCLLAYWPLSFGIFSVKNDAIHYFLPYRFQISETLRNGEFPFWNPYIYLGYPVYGDMQSGAWNPIVWFFSIFGRYDITLFHFENLLYIFLGGVGMYKLVRQLADESRTALLAAIAYMLSGFMLSGQLINWLAAAAFLPFILHYYLKAIRQVNWSSAIKTGVALFFLFTAGYPSFFILTFYLLLLIFIYHLATIFFNKDASKINWKKFLLQQILIGVVFTGLSLPAIISFIDLLPYYQRGAGISYADSATNSFEWQHLISLFFPSHVNLPGLLTSTDLTCRNVYVGLFAIFILIVFPPRLNRRNILLLTLTVFALLFSLGDATPVQKICYKIIPLMDVFRHPSQTRLFFILGILLLAVPGIKRVMQNELSPTDRNKIKYMAIGMAVLFLIITIIAFTRSGLSLHIRRFQFDDIRESAKAILSILTPADAFTINGLIQFIFMIALFLSFRKQSRPMVFAILWVLNLFILAQLSLPATFVGKTSPKEINAIIQRSPKGFPLTGTDRSLEENSKDAFDQIEKSGLAFFYNKKPGISRVTNSPSFLTELEGFLTSTLIYEYVAARPLVYLADSLIAVNDTAKLLRRNECNYAFVDNPIGLKNSCKGGYAIIRKLTANTIEVETETEAGGLLVLTQNYHHHWKVRVNGIASDIIKTNISFMSIPLSGGKYQVEFRFKPGNTLKAMWAPPIIIVLLLAAMLTSRITSGRLKKRIT